MQNPSVCSKIKKIPPWNFSPGLCGHAGCLGLAVEPKIWAKKMNLKVRGNSKIEWGRERIRLRHAWTERDCLFYPSDYATPSHFQIHFSPIFWALQLSRDNLRDHKDQD